MCASSAGQHPVISFRPQGWLGKLLDGCMRPVMYWLQGNYSELPQRTHRWNNLKFRHGELDQLDATAMVHAEQILKATERWQGGVIPRFHLARFGGWTNYFVVQPVTPCNPWFVGWRTSDVQGLSIIPLTGPVRVLRGPGQTEWFGLDRTGRQIAITKLGHGMIGQGGINLHGEPTEYGSIPLR